jgi:hypothetical protein
MAETKRLAMTKRDAGRGTGDGVKVGGQGFRRAEMTANGDWRTACWSGYQPRRAISHDEASPFPKPFQLSTSWFQRRTMLGRFTTRTRDAPLTIS